MDMGDKTTLQRDAVSEADLSGLCSFLLATLTASAGPITEHQLLARLKGRGFPMFDLPFADNWSLFRAHFLLFHCLYRARDTLWTEQKGHLHIHALRIELAPYSPAPAGLVDHDPLREYYLDLSQLEETTEAKVEEMISSFWTRLASLEGRPAALAELGLVDPVDDRTIKRRYRELAMRHHPDRGGCKKQQQRINAAMRRLFRRHDT
ncbi:MAG: DnaJ domain-containing protein [Candidatus Riflebacteria bacterium]|nr:DnaJ domain-containing protein [Candidatus Riflebacteria bacterium]